MQTGQRTLEQGAIIPLPTEGKSIAYAFGHLDIQHVNGHQVSVAYRYTDQGVEKTIPCIAHNLDNGPITIGKKSGNTIVLPKPADLVDSIAKLKCTENSGLQGTISLDHNDNVAYQHNGSNKIHNPHFSDSTPEHITTIIAEAGSGGGFTHENRTHNPRTSNEDRGLAHRGLPLKDAAAINYLKSTITDAIVPQTRDHHGGSTLSIAMRTKDKNFACAYLGDSPIFMIVQNDNTGQIQLLPMGIPHNRLGLHIRSALSKMDYLPPLNFDSMLELLESTAPEVVALARSQNPDPKLRNISKGLGQMGDYPRDDYTHLPDTFILHPQSECPKGHTFKGVLVCSDGMENGVHCGKVPEALTKVFSAQTSPSPTDISKAAVMAALPYTTDNITAMMLPAVGKAGDLVAVADGNYNTAEVAEAAAHCLRLQCQNTFVPFVVKKDNQYRISLQGNITPKQEAKTWLEGLSQTLHASDPKHAFQMGTHVVRETLIVKNPTQYVSKYLDSVIRDQERSPDRGRI